jgi:hypothetical protein
MQDSGSQPEGRVQGVERGTAGIRVVNHPYKGEIHTFGISGEQLKEFEKGIPIPLYLNFSIFFLSIAGSLIGSMIPSFTDSNTNPIPFWIKIAFYCGITFLVVGIILMIKWYIMNRRLRNLADEVRSSPPEGTPAV